MREDLLLGPVTRFFAQRIFGPTRKILLEATLPTTHTDPLLQTRHTAAQTEIADLQRRQQNLMRELENYEPTGDTDLDTAWRSGIQTRFASNATQLRIKTQQIADIVRQQAEEAPPDVDLIDDLPIADIDVTQLPEGLQRQLYDAFHLEIRYDHPNNALNLRVTLDAATVPALANAITEILDLPRQRTAAETQKPGVGSQTAPTPGKEGWDVLRAPGRIRTCAPASGGRCSIP